MKQQSNSISQGLGHVRTARASAAIAVAAITFTILLFCGVAQVEGGCSRFGHSCFGAHGKRADIGPVVDGRVLDNLPAGDLVYPPSASYAANYPSLNGVRLSPYFLDWLLATRRDQDPQKSHDQINFNENNGAGAAGAPLDMRK